MQSPAVFAQPAEALTSINSLGWGSASLEQVRRLSEQGSSELALRMLDTLRKQAPEQDWLTLEKERVYLLTALGRWDQADQRLIEMGKEMPSQQSWVNERRAALALQADKPARTLEILNDLIRDDVTHTPQDAHFAQWRRLLIRAYLKLNRDQDADRAMQAYLRDYGNQPEQALGADDIRLLEARVLLRNGKAQAVPALLEVVEDSEAQLLRLLARLRLEPKAARSIMMQATALASHNDISRSLKFEAWALVAEAAKISGHQPGHILALERLLGAERLPRDLTENFGIRAGSLWSAYLSHGREVVFQQSLALGDTRRMLGWVEPALSREPVKARGVLALILDGERDPELWSRSADLMMDLLSAGHGGDRLVVRLMGRPDWHPAISTLPVESTLRLVEKAVGMGDLESARRLMSGLSGFNAAQDDLAWHQRMARIALLVGDEATALRHINRLMDPQTGVIAQPGQAVDGLVQLLLDVQAQGRHETALTLFQRLSRLPIPASMQKELAFWMADSFRARQQYEQAAIHYLRSADLAHEQAQNQTNVVNQSAAHWHQTALFEAARALEKAGLLSDARFQYQRLLQSARDPQRLAMLRARLERLAVKEAVDLSSEVEAFRPSQVKSPDYQKRQKIVRQAQ